LRSPASVPHAAAASFARSRSTPGAVGVYVAAKKKRGVRSHAGSVRLRAPPRPQYAGSRGFGAHLRMVARLGRTTPARGPTPSAWAVGEGCRAFRAYLRRGDARPRAGVDNRRRRPVCVSAPAARKGGFTGVPFASSRLRRGGAPPGYGGDPPGFKIDDCKTQRNLDEQGRGEARA
jgi:hypothetical protein